MLEPAPAPGSPRLPDVEREEDAPATAVARVPVGKVLVAEEEAMHRKNKDNHERRREGERQQKSRSRAHYSLSPLRNSELTSHADGTSSYRPAALINHNNLIIIK